MCELDVKISKLLVLAYTAKFTGNVDILHKLAKEIMEERNFVNHD